MADKKLFPESGRSLQDSVRNSASVAGAAYTLVGALLLGAVVGRAIDVWRDTSPWGLVIGLFLGVIIGFYELIRTVYQK